MFPRLFPSPHTAGSVAAHTQQGAYQATHSRERGSAHTAETVLGRPCVGRCPLPAVAAPRTERNALPRSCLLAVFARMVNFMHMHAGALNRRPSCPKMGKAVL
eukprot:354321-Chlamydomonas_euryale.AAC.1